MHSTENRLFPGLPNIDLILIELQFLCPIYRAFQCCNIVICLKQTIELRNSYHPSLQFMYIKAQLSHHSGVNHPQCLSYP